MASRSSAWCKRWNRVYREPYFRSRLGKRRARKHSADRRGRSSRRRDVNGDGHTDLLLAGNFDGFKPEIGRLAAIEGLVLLGDGTGKLAAVRPTVSGFRVPGQSRDIQRVRTGRGDLLVVARNNARPLVFSKGK